MDKMIMDNLHNRFIVLSVTVGGPTPDDVTRCSGGFPRGWAGHAFVAQHGSWNRSPPIGYRVRVPRPLK